MHFTSTLATSRAPRMPLPDPRWTLLPRSETTTEPTRADEDAEGFRCCGWFDSSLDLACGLQVTEFTDLLPIGLPWQCVGTQD